jgi:hypothetical protein
MLKVITQLRLSHRRNLGILVHDLALPVGRRFVKLHFQTRHIPQRRRLKIIATATDDLLDTEVRKLPLKELPDTLLDCSTVEDGNSDLVQGIGFVDRSEHECKGGASHSSFIYRFPLTSYRGLWRGHIPDPRMLSLLYLCIPDLLCGRKAFTPANRMKGHIFLLMGKEVAALGCQCAGMVCKSSPLLCRRNGRGVLSFQVRDSRISDLAEPNLGIEPRNQVRNVG